eukprot:NODE_2454_length_1576_cov_43.865795_g2111_i0.p1 GENE.NODE_2454_length_1576_cov_43.865795_g2111_i0~~NODE_2454_length_1576_cov_43.865795_g2111_i0.p1  ORF type:complete len:465 (-),score=119.64 NODE_2454_length_1576_cov_43.865795_g2111_i0:110-1504(-)
MLSVLHRQSKILEQELKERQLEVLHLTQLQKEHLAKIEEQVITIKELEEELALLRARKFDIPKGPSPEELEAKRLEESKLAEESAQQIKEAERKVQEAEDRIRDAEEKIKLEAEKRLKTLEEKEQYSKETAAETQALMNKIKNLESELSNISEKLAMSELRSSVLNLQVQGKEQLQNRNSELVKQLSEVKEMLNGERNHTQDIENELKIRDNKISQLNQKLKTTEEQKAQAIEALHKSQELELKIGALTNDIQRRDEQIEFLMHVHDTSAAYAWVGNSGGGPAAREDPSKLDYLIQMGFERSVALSALQDFDWDEMAAVNFLLALGTSSDESVNKQSTHGLEGTTAKLQATSNTTNTSPQSNKAKPSPKFFFSYPSQSIPISEPEQAFIIDLQDRLHPKPKPSSQTQQNLPKPNTQLMNRSSFSSVPIQGGLSKPKPSFQNSAPKQSTSDMNRTNIPVRRIGHS